jgi:hypothetical protein
MTAKTIIRPHQLKAVQIHLHGVIVKSLTYQLAIATVQADHLAMCQPTTARATQAHVVRKGIFSARILKVVVRALLIAQVNEFSRQLSSQRDEFSK